MVNCGLLKYVTIFNMTPYHTDACMLDNVLHFLRTEGLRLMHDLATLRNCYRSRSDVVSELHEIKILWCIRGKIPDSNPTIGMQSLRAARVFPNRSENPSERLSVTVINEVISDCEAQVCSKFAFIYGRLIFYLHQLALHYSQIRVDSFRSIFVTFSLFHNRL